MFVVVVVVVVDVVVVVVVVVLSSVFCVVLVLALLSLSSRLFLSLILSLSLAKLPSSCRCSSLLCFVVGVAVFSWLVVFVTCDLEYCCCLSACLFFFVRIFCVFGDFVSVGGVALRDC